MAWRISRLGPGGLAARYAPRIELFGALREREAGSPEDAQQ